MPCGCISASRSVFAWWRRLAARGIIVTHETVRQWARKVGQQFANQIRRRLPRAGDKWHLDEVVLKISGVMHWLWRAVDHTRIVRSATHATDGILYKSILNPIRKICVKA
jgi:hypothetical protein